MFIKTYDIALILSISFLFGLIRSLVIQDIDIINLILLSNKVKPTASCCFNIRYPKEAAKICEYSNLLIFIVVNF